MIKTPKGNNTMWEGEREWKQKNKGWRKDDKDRKGVLSFLSTMANNQISWIT